MSAFPKISYHIFGHWRQDSSHHLTKLARTGPRLDSFSWSRLTITELSTYFKITVFSNLLLHIFVHRINYKVKSTGEPVKEQARLDRIDKVSLASSTPMKTLNFVYINLMYFNDIFHVPRWISYRENWRLWNTLCATLSDVCQYWSPKKNSCVSMKGWIFNFMNIN